MKINDRVLACKTPAASFYLYQTDGGYICFDTGLGKGAVLGQLRQEGIEPDAITHVFLTHADTDHTGGIPLFEHAGLYLSCDEEQMITGKTARFFGLIRGSGLRRPYILLQDGELIQIGASQVRAIATPGHTPGSMCYLVDENVLFVGDTFNLKNGKVTPFSRFINMDTEEQLRSIRKLARLQNVQLACTGHSVWTTQYDQAMEDWK